MFWGQFFCCTLLLTTFIFFFFHTNFFKLLDKAMNQRHVTATKMNSESSRSHLIVSVMLDVKDIHTGGIITGKLTLVDLAGSERVKKSEAKGQGEKFSDFS